MVIDGLNGVLDVFDILFRKRFVETNKAAVFPSSILDVWGLPIEPGLDRILEDTIKSWNRTKHTSGTNFDFRP